MDTDKRKVATKGWGGDCCCCLITKLCPTLFAIPWIVASLPGSSVHGIAQARILEWVAIPLPGDLPNSGIEPASPALAGGFFILSHQGSYGGRGGGGIES